MCPPCVWNVHLPPAILSFHREHVNLGSGRLREAGSAVVPVDPAEPVCVKRCLAFALSADVHVALDVSLLGGGRNSRSCSFTGDDPLSAGLKSAAGIGCPPR